MTALAIERLTDFAGIVPARGTYPIAADTLIFKGAQVALDSAGRVVPAGTVAATGALVAVGKASATYDNRTGSVLGGGAGAVDVEVEFGVFGWESAGGGDAISADDIGKPCFMEDDQTVALTDGADTRAFAGFVTEVDADGQVFVWQGPHVAAFHDEIEALQDAALTTQGFVPLPLGGFNLAASGGPLVVFNDGVADGLVFAEGEMYRFNVSSTAAIGVTVPLPPDLDDSKDVVVHIMASREGTADPTAAITVAAFFQTDGAAYDADADAGGATDAVDGGDKVVGEVTRTITAANVPAVPALLSLSLVPTAALDADDMNVHGVWLEYTKKLLAS